MSAREIQDQKVMALEMMVQQAADANADVSASPLPGDTICSIKSRRDYILESKAEDGFYEPTDASLLPTTRVDAANLIRALQQLEVIAKRQAPRIAFKAKGRILFLGLAEIVAVQAEGNCFAATPAQSLFAARVPLVHGGEAQALRFYSHSPLGRCEYFGCGGDPTFADRRVQVACKGWGAILGNAHIQR